MNCGSVSKKSCAINFCFLNSGWGNLVFEAIGYTNEWNPIDHTEGTYFYLLKINGLDKEYSGFFQLVK